jgi:hypothetical protein
VHGEFVLTPPLVFDRPKGFQQPFTFSFVEGLLPDTDVYEHSRSENERDAWHQLGRAAQ